jgi:hypothetical protein
MGLFDLPAPALSWADGCLAALLPALGRIVFWGAVGAAVSLGLYWLLSPQRRIGEIAEEERRLRTRLKDDTIEMADGLAASKDLLRLALSRMGIVLVPVLLATLPLISTMTWLDTNYAYRLPPAGQAPQVTILPDVAQGRWVSAGDGPPRVEITRDGTKLQSMTMSAPVPVIEKWTWWNALIGNPLGYVPDDSPIHRVEIGLPSNEYLSFGPDWLRGWLAPFLISLLVFSLLFKITFRIH